MSTSSGPLRLPPQIAFALEDRPQEFVNDDSPEWSPAWAILGFERKGMIHMIPMLWNEFAAALTPADPMDMLKMLTVMTTVFSVTRSSLDAGALDAFLSEGVRLLAELPHDIARAAIDEAILESADGFLPSIGAIWKVGEPLLAYRRQKAKRLIEMIEWMDEQPAETDFRDVDR